MNSNTKKQNLIQNGIFAVAMAAAAVFLVWKCQYGFSNFDESLYTAIPYRLWQGDALFADEWNLSSFSSFLLLPFMHIYMAIVGTTEGILLNFRYIFTAVQGLCAVVVYLRLKNYSWYGALAAALTFFLYAPFGIMALSYNSMGIQCMTIAMLLVLTDSKGSKLSCAVAGALFAASVLCCPYLVAVYALYTVLVVINIAKKGCFRLEILQKNSWLWVTCGVTVMAVLFLAFALSRASLAEILTGLQWMLNDPQHEAQSIVFTAKRYITGILKCNDISLYIFAGYVLLAVVYIFSGRKLPKALFFAAGAVLCGLMMAPFVTWQLYINSTIFPVNVFGAFCVLLSDSDSVKRLFKLLWIPGMLYGVCIHFASTEGFLNIASVSLVSLMASLVIVVLVGVEIVENCNINLLSLFTLSVVAAVLVMQTGAVAYTRYQSVFWESGIWGDGMPAQTQRLTQGPEKGILATEEKQVMYNAFAEDVTALNEENQGKNIVFVSQHTWLYLLGEDMHCSSFSAWLPGLDEEQMRHTMERLDVYLDINESKTPDIICAEEKYRSLAADLADRYGYRETVTENGNYIYSR